MLVLGIETSCDETGAAVLEFGADARATIRSELVSSQVKLHERYGGVVPELASREHLQNLPPIVDAALSEAGISTGDLGLVAVTRGPGLKGCLLIGVSFARGLAQSLALPIVGVNHIEGHLLAPILDCPELSFPYLALVVSGGHTEIVEVRGYCDYILHARTIDDAAGEAFDKSANLLGLSYPGGAKLAELADSFALLGSATQIKLPKVMREQAGFSFSGLKTAISLRIAKESGRLLAPSLKAELAFAIQEAIVDALIFKLNEIVSKTGIRKVTLTGGVAANSRLREAVLKLSRISAVFPSRAHCTDNAAMIAYAGFHSFSRGESLSFSADVLSTWPVESVSNHG